MNNCSHKEVICLNQYDLIRKYACECCKEIMMCSCDEEHGNRFLPHQLGKASWFGSRERISVTKGFQENICPECRGGIAVPSPKASLPGATSKIVRYYWREISFETTLRFYNARPELDPNDVNVNEFSFPKERRVIEKEVIAEIKERHIKKPKYEYTELSAEHIINITNTEVINVNAEHIKIEGRKVGIKNGDKISTVEEYAADHFKNKGYKSLEVESVPFHVLFGIFMYIVIQDADDEKGQVVQFGSRSDYESGINEEGLVTTILPDDFGSSMFYERQKTIIDLHLDELEEDDNLEWLFDYWLEYSVGLRQYLWAHRQKDIDKAKQVMGILGVNNLIKALRYMVRDYWNNFCGWPDLLVFNEDEFFFVEVKSSKDKLSEEQKNWLIGNQKYMGFKAKIFKVGKEIKA